MELLVVAMSCGFYRSSSQGRACLCFGRRTLCVDRAQVCAEASRKFVGQILAFISQIVAFGYVMAYVIQLFFACDVVVDELVVVEAYGCVEIDARTSTPQ